MELRFSDKFKSALGDVTDRKVLHPAARMLVELSKAQDIEAGDDTSKRKLDDLFKAEDVFSSKRPTPVQWN